MTVDERVELIKNLQDAMPGTLILTYITSTRSGLETLMAMDAIRKIYRHLQLIKTPKDKTVINLFLSSNGGDGVVPWRLVTLIREYCHEFNVLIPHRAFSAATLTAIGADKIYMHPMGILGPTDPKVNNEFNPKDPANPTQSIGINVEDVISYISLVKEDIGIHHEDELVKALELLASESRIHPLALGNVKRFYAQSRMMAKKLLELHMDKQSEEHKINEIADNLNSKLYFHGHPINRTEARNQLGLKIEPLTKKVEDAMWDLYEAYESEMKLENNFNPSLELKKITPVLPLNTGPHATIDIEEKVAFIESETRSDFLNIGFHIEGFRNAQNPSQESINLSQTKEDWITETPTPQTPRVAVRKSTVVKSK